MIRYLLKNKKTKGGKQVKTKEITQACKNIMALCKEYERYQTADELYGIYIKLDMEFRNLKELLADELYVEKLI